MKDIAFGVFSVVVGFTCATLLGYALVLGLLASVELLKAMF